MLTSEEGIDSPPTPAPANLALPFDLTQLSHVRVRPADLARMLNVTRQAVSQWIKDGKITLGADRRVDPQVAVRQLLHNCDPSRLRAKVLQPLTRDIGDQRRQIADLKGTIASLTEDRNFHAAAAAEMLEVIDEFKWLLIASWPELSQVAGAEPLDAEFERLIDQAFTQVSNRNHELTGDGLDADLAELAALANDVSILEFESRSGTGARTAERIEGGGGGL